MTGNNRATASGFSGAGSRIHLAQIIPAGEWTIAEGDVFEFSAWLRPGANFAVGTDAAQLILHVVNSNGAPVADAANFQGGTQDRLMEFNITAGQFTQGAYIFASGTSNPIAAGSPWIGQQVQVRILANGARSDFMLDDDVTLEATAAGGSELGDFEITRFSYDPITNEVTLRWPDIGGSYIVEGKGDLDFTSGVTIVDVDGTADRTSFPGEIEFKFIQPIDDDRFFWRVLSTQ